MELWISAAVAYVAAFGIAGMLIGGNKNAEVAGVFLGVLLGPIGLLIAAIVDNRHMCPQCGVRLNGTPAICPGCSDELKWPD